MFSAARPTPRQAPIKRSWITSKALVRKWRCAGRSQRRQQTMMVHLGRNRAASAPKKRPQPGGRAEAARWLRYVDWQNRHARTIRQPEIRSKHSVLIPRPERKKAAEIVSGLSGKMRA